MNSIGAMRRFLFESTCHSELCSRYREGRASEINRISRQARDGRKIRMQRRERRQHSQ